MIEIVLALGILVFAISVCLVILPVASQSSQEIRRERVFADILQSIESDMGTASFDKLAHDGGTKYFDVQGLETFGKQNAVYMSQTRVSESANLPGGNAGSSALKKVTVELRPVGSSERPYRFSFLVADQGR